MLDEDDRGLLSMFRVDHTTVPGLSLDWAGWEDNEDRPRSAEELVDAFNKTWGVVEACLDRWSLDDLNVEVTSEDAGGRLRTITPGWVIWRLISYVRPLRRERHRPSLGLCESRRHGHSVPPRHGAARISSRK